MAVYEHREIFCILIRPVLVSNSLTWEKASTVNVGLDMTFLQQKLDVSFDWYQRTTSDMLVKVEYPEVLGTTAPPANMAALRTRGWELSINWNDRIGKDFTYSLGLILSDSQAEITKYTNKNGSLSDHYVGEKIGEIRGYETEGFYQTESDLTSHADQAKLGSNWDLGDIMYKDLNNDGKIDNGSNTLADHGDLKVIGNTTPRYQYGITANLGYKNIYMNIFFRGSASAITGLVVSRSGLSLLSTIIRRNGLLPIHGRKITVMLILPVRLPVKPRISRSRPSICRMHLTAA